MCLTLNCLGHRGGNLQNHFAVIVFGRYDKVTSKEI